MKDEEPPKVELNSKEHQIAAVLQEVIRGNITRTAASGILDISVRHVRRKLVSLKECGAESLAHKARGKPSNHQLSPELREKVINLVREKYFDMGPTQASEMLKERDNIDISHETLRRWLDDEGLREVAPAKKTTHRRRRTRRACHGELVQMDTSEHHWFGDELPMVQFIAMIDDASSTLYGRMYDTDSTVTNMDCIIGYIRRYGRPVELYTDQASHFKVNKDSKDKTNHAVDQRDGSEPKTQIERALKESDIAITHAHSPQAKGRVERLFETLQDRLTKVMRLDSINSIEAANEYLENYYLPKWNKKFTVEPVSNFNAHRSAKEYDLEAIFSIQDERTVTNDFTIKFNSKIYQIEPGNFTGDIRRKKVLMEVRLDGSVKARYKGKYLHIHQI
jgi:transposase